MPPAVRVAPKTLGGRLEFIPAPGEEADLLRSPGTAIVLLAETETDLAITVIPHPGSNSTAIELHLELLASPASSNVLEEHGEKRDVEPFLPGQISLLGHVARRGDVLVQTGEWLGGPEFPARIEGLEIRWLRMPPGLELEYSVMVGGKTPRKWPTCRVNEFAGTKGRASPIVGLTIALRGEHANSYQIRAECIFLGGPMINQCGPKISLAGATGREPLVGLRLWIDPRSLSTKGTSVV
jgi:hypothetical protein